MALCNLIYVKEYKHLMSKLFCWLIFVKCTIVKRNYYAYLILTSFCHDGYCKTMLTSFLFKKYYINTNTIFNHSQLSKISQCSTSIITIHTNIIIFQVIIAILLNNILTLCLFHSHDFKLDLIIWGGGGFQPY